MFWSSLQNWSGSLLSAVVFIVLARLLDPSDFGLIAMASVFTALMAVLIDLGIPSALIQRAKLDPEHLDTGFWMGAAIGASLLVAGLLAAPLIAWMFDEPRLAGVVRLLSVNFVFVGLSGTATAVLKRGMQFKLLAIRSISASLVGGVVGITMAVMQFGAYSLVGQRLAETLTQLALLWIACPWRPSMRFSPGHGRDLLSFGLNVLGTRVMNFFSRRSDDFLIGFFLGSVALGYYVVAYRLIRIVLEVLTKSLSSVLLPALSRLQHDRGRLREAYLRALRLLAMVTVPVFAGIGVLAPNLVIALFGDAWRPSINVTRILSVAGLLQALFFLNAPTMKAIGKPSWVMRMAVLDGITNVAAFAIAVHWGIAAVAAAFTIRLVLFSPLRFYLLRKLIDVDTGSFFRQLVPALLAAATMSAVAMCVQYFAATRWEPAGSLIAALLASILAYGMALMLVAPHSVRHLLETGHMALPLGARKR